MVGQRHRMRGVRARRTRYIFEMRTDISDIFPVNFIKLKRYPYALLLGFAVPIRFKAKAAKALFIGRCKHLPTVIYGNRATAIKQITVEVELAVNDTSEKEINNLKKCRFSGPVFSNDYVKAVIKDDFLSFSDVGYEFKTQNV